MPIDIKVECSPDVTAAGEIRTLFCRESANSPIPERNPITETKFNALLDRIAQIAFEEGRRFVKNHPDL